MWYSAYITLTCYIIVDVIKGISRKDMNLLDSEIFIIRGNTHQLVT